MGFSNNIIRRRVVSGSAFTPASLNPTIWYEGASTAYTDVAGTTLVTTNSQQIALWKNKGSLGASLDATQYTSGARPTVGAMSPFKTAFASGNFWSMASNNISVTTASTIWLRFKLDASVVGQTAIGCPALDFLGSGSFDALFAHLVTSGYPSGIYFLLGGTVGSGSTQNSCYVPYTADSNWHTLIISRTPDGSPNASDTTEYSVWLDGVSKTVLAGNLLGNQGGNQIGRQTNGNQFFGNMASIGRVNAALTSGQASDLTTYLSAFT